MSKKLILLGLFLLPFHNGFAQTLRDSLLTHYPLRVGNIWDYRGAEIFINRDFPEWTIVTAASDSLHPNGHSYTVLRKVIYEMVGRENSQYVYGNTSEEITLQRVDSTSLNVYEVAEGQTEERLIDSLRAKIGDPIAMDVNGGRYFFELLSFDEQRVFGQFRKVRFINIIDGLIGYSFSTAEGLGEISHAIVEGSGVLRDLAGAVIDNDTSGFLLRLEPAALAAQQSRLTLTNIQRSGRLTLVNNSSGLALIDSVFLAGDALFDFTAEAFYQSLSFPVDTPREDPYLVFPQDSLALIITATNVTSDAPLVDTLRIYARGLNGELLPRLDIPIFVDFTVAVRESGRTRELPRSFALSAGPNPISLGSRLNISYQVPTLQNVTIQVYDILGRVVARIVQGNLQSGKQRIGWDPGNVSSGTYFLQVKGSSVRETLKIQIVQ